MQVLNGLSVTDSEEIADSVMVLNKKPHIAEHGKNDYMGSYLTAVSQNEIARMVKLADKLHNLQESLGILRRIEHVNDFVAIEHDLKFIMKEIRKTVRSYKYEGNSISYQDLQKDTIFDKPITETMEELELLMIRKLDSIGMEDLETFLEK